MDIFNSEADVRKWMKRYFDKRVFRIEAGIGGDDGLQDVLLAWRGRLVPIELKKCNLIYTPDFRELKITVKVRTAQKLVAERMHKVGVKSFVLCGIIGTGNLMVGLSHSVYVSNWAINTLNYVNDGKGLERYIEQKMGEG